MAKRTLVRLEDVASFENLAAAFWCASRGKRTLPDVRRFEENLEGELTTLSRQILDLSVPVGRLRSFQIFDPKPRTIHAPCFRERVFHHALMALVGPVLERSLVDDSFACRVGKGTLAAVLRAQQLACKHRFFAKLDARSYFASIDHDVLRSLLRRLIQGRGVLALLDRVVASHQSAAGRGLPIGALTSQHFANLYLGGVDRLVLEKHRLGLVRYMDDVVLFGQEGQALGPAVQAVGAYGRERLRLALEVHQQPTATRRGLALCGFRVFPDRLLLSRRRQRRYRRARRACESAFTLGLIGSRELQDAYASALAVTAHAQAGVWRRGDLHQRPAPDA